MKEEVRDTEMNAKLEEVEVTKNIQQWCPEVENIVVLTVRGAIKGNLIEGDVADCNCYECKISNSAKRFCWLKKRIITAIW